MKLKTNRCSRLLAMVILFATCQIMPDANLKAIEPMKPKLLVGTDANYVLDMERERATWNWNEDSVDLFAGMAKRGVTQFRLRVWTKDEGSNGKNDATEIAKRALQAGLDPYLVLFLSDDWADLMKQPVPAAWKDLSFEDRIVAVENYSRDTVAHFRREGVRSHLYEIGNEIDYGICGEYPGKSSQKTSDALSKRCWPRAAKLILASQAGVLQADPEAKFMLHISHWWDPQFCEDFFRFMLKQGVKIDFAGLSYFPTSNIGGSLQIEEFGSTVSRLSKAIGRQIIIPETAYPCTHDFKGQFSRWKYEVLGYPFSEKGQRQWVEDFLTYCELHPDIHSVYYWSPEWYGEGMWKGFALFDPKGNARQAWNAFDSQHRSSGTIRKPVYFEVHDNTLYRIPLDAAKKQMVAMVNRLRTKTGGVNKEHIDLLGKTELLVPPYRIHLRSSLQQNLSMELHEKSNGISLAEDWELLRPKLQNLAESLDRDRDKVVIVDQNEINSPLSRAIQYLEEMGIRVDHHRKGNDRPLQFGMSGQFTSESKN